MCFQYHNNLPSNQVAPQAQELRHELWDYRASEDLTGMGFYSPNYSPIPQVRNTPNNNKGSSVLTSTPIVDWMVRI